MKLLPLMRMPLREAPPRPPKKVRGTLITKAQGQDTTKKMRARWSQVAKEAEKPEKPFPDSSGGTSASRRAAETTIGV